MTERVTSTIRDIAWEAIQEAMMEVMYEDEHGQTHIPEEKLYEVASKNSKLPIHILKWAEDEIKKINQLD